MANTEMNIRGMEAARCYLERRGYEVVDTDWSCRAGGIDIVAWDEGTLVFVEVKTRTNLDGGLPEEAIRPEKRQRLEITAAHYLQEHDFINIPLRFDAISLLVISNDRAMIRHHINVMGMGD